MEITPYKWLFFNLNSYFASASSNRSGRSCATVAIVPKPPAAFRRRRFSHRARQPIDELVIFSFEEQVRKLHRRAVLLFRTDLSDARRDTPLDVVLEAGPRPLAGDDFVARTDAEQPVGQPHRPARE